MCRASWLEVWSGLAIENNVETHMHATRTKHSCTLLTHTSHARTRIACARDVHDVAYVAWMRGVRACIGCIPYVISLGASRASCICMYGVRAWRGWYACARVAFAWMACRLACSMHVCFNIIFNFNPVSVVKSACKTHAMQTRMRAMHETLTYAHTRACALAKGLFLRTLYTLPEYDDFGYLKVKGMVNTGSAISRL